MLKYLIIYSVVVMVAKPTFWKYIMADKKGKDK